MFNHIKIYKCKKRLCTEVGTFILGQFVSVYTRNGRTIVLKGSLATEKMFKEADKYLKHLPLLPKGYYNLVVGGSGKSVVSIEPEEFMKFFKKVR